MLHKYYKLFTVGAVGYPLLEIIFRGWSHWSMSLAGGCSACLLWWLETRLPQRALLRKCLYGSALITGVEFVIGCMFNLLLQRRVWDYSHLPLNLLGQICLPFCMIWFLLCLPVFGLFRRLRPLLTSGQ